MLAPDSSPFVLENPEKLPTLELYRRYFPFDNDVYKAVPVEGTQSEGLSPIYRNKKTVKRIKTFLLEGLETVHDIFEDIVSQVPDSPCFKYRPYDYKSGKSEDVYKPISFAEVQQMKNDLGAGILYSLQNNPFKNSQVHESHRKIDNHVSDYKTYDCDNHSFVVTLYSSNRYEWIVTDLACASFAITDTALYDTLGESASEFILSLTQSPIVVCSKQHVRGLIDLKRKFPKELAPLISIVSMDPLFIEDRPLVELGEKSQIKVFDFDQVMGLGRLFPLENLPPNASTMYTISFTSGTTGSNPKGVCLTQENAGSTLSFLLPQVLSTPDAFSFLPYAHIFERETALITMATGACLVMPQLNYTPLTLIEDLKLAKPTRISLVPRILNKFEAVIKSNTINNPNFSDFKKSIFTNLFNSKMDDQCHADGNEGRRLILDKLIINKIKTQFGFDNINYVITGSAPIDPETVRFLKASLQIGVSQGYGCTETFAGMCLSRPFEANPGSSGCTAGNTEIQIREIPEMNYTLQDEGGPRGELLIRGSQIFKGYYKDPEETAKALDSEGWFHTGDVARIDAVDGKITIIDRVKNFFKLAQGEYIAPESIENNYQSNNPILSQMFIHGDSLKDYLVAVLGIDKASQIEFLAKQCKLSPKQLTSLTDEALLKLINEKNNKRTLLSFLNKSVPQLKGFQKIKNAYIEFEPLTLERDVVTPTMKVKRPIAKKFFSDVLSSMYKEGPISGDAKL
ncbi:medium-chain fatty acid-CoA ligase faa2 [Yamadazyma tenuis]|uniref:Acetyl-CoA synthetase-like protein n=1 Tax=Candida tenuis (strain ATCC 10573 / BCRC 21748 / CBS 615 / JCM 9827 / NBRC 10315 / NRRL Y-1498 / VKM Y-70) TaxID=590646 RepID=G3AY21_CANTC|nr:acetyl-CoA synthetase-like protein [Yamadazyma tenuis ATCC 10573]EGV65751.1 acetyl-CoA synthetase-like protein [Yamadazyma tenuis ATCC 10573]WEJ95930.1 medium-chain fatty acid-CoA ligase faa2 [Yamadazyma tenuis]